MRCVCNEAADLLFKATKKNIFSVGREFKKLNVYYANLANKKRKSALNKFHGSLFCIKYFPNPINKTSPKTRHRVARFIGKKQMKIKTSK